MHWDWHAYPWGWGTMLVMSIFLVLLVLGIAYLVRSFAIGKGSQKEDTASDILEKRYARGEITKEEFEEMKRNIRK